MTPSELFEYQIEGAQYLADRKFALLADEMGLGKSAQTIHASDIIGAKKILVVCPASARVNWQREFERFSDTPRKFTVMTDKKTDAWEDSVICSYDLVTSIPKTLTFDVMILDEAHYLKNPTAQRTQAIYGKEGLVRRSKRTWCLSGTPAPNNASELWPMFYTFNITKFSYDDFVKEYCNHYVFDHKRLQITGTRADKTQEIRDLLLPHMIRRKKEDVLKQLPPIYFEQLTVEPGLVDLELESSFATFFYPKNRADKLHEEIERQKLIMQAAIRTININGEMGNNVLQGLYDSVATLRRYNGLQKVEAVTEMVIKELAAKAYDKIVIFAIHRDVIESLRKNLKDFNPVTLYGGTPPEKRQKNIDRFQRTRKYKVFIGNITSAGTAITLTAAHQVLFIEQSWVPGDNLQAAMRCHRIGQTKAVTVRNVCLNDSLDEKIVYAVQRKTKELARIFDRELREPAAPLPEEIS